VRVIALQVWLAACLAAPLTRVQYRRRTSNFSAFNHRPFKGAGVPAHAYE
jgi:hypothetical protein